MKKSAGKKANAFIEKKLGGEPLAAAAQAGFQVKDGDGGDGSGENDSRPMVQLPGVGRPGSAFAHQMGNIFAKEPIFRRDRLPVMVNEENGMVEALSADEFRTVAEEYAITFKLIEVKGGHDDEPTTMTKDVAGCTLKAPQFLRALRKLDRVNFVRMPVREGETVRLLPTGYDAETRTYTIESDVKINEALKPEEGQTVVADYLSEFPFNDPRSRAVAVGAMVALFVSQMQELTAARIGFVYRSNVEGAGKSLCAQTAISAAYGLAKGQPLAGREELRKLLDATALQGSPYLFLDNLTGHVASELLDAYMTTPVWTGRILGTAKIFEAPANAMLFITGNNITLSPDIARRSLVCNLNVEEADPNERQPKRVMTPQYLARPQVRGDLLSALWAMVRGWKAAGCPPGARRIRSFEEWSDLVGGIVLANGFGDCLAKPADEESPNMKEVDKREIVARLVGMFPEGKRACEFKFEEIVEACHDTDRFDRECFEWIIEGKMTKKRIKLYNGDWDEEEKFEITRPSAAKLAHIIHNEMGGQIFRLKDGRRVRFGKRGKQRHKRFTLEVLEQAVAVAATAQSA